VAGTGVQCSRRDRSREEVTHGHSFSLCEQTEIPRKGEPAGGRGARGGLTRRKDSPAVRDMPTLLATVVSTEFVLPGRNMMASSLTPLFDNRITIVAGRFAGAGLLSRASAGGGGGARAGR